MTTILGIILVLAGLCIVVFLVGYIYLHDFAQPSFEIREYVGKNSGINVLFIFPHPDDEIFTVGGTMAAWAGDNDINVHAVSVTKGEKGDELLKLPPQELADIREEEYTKSLTVLGVKKYELWDFPDAEVADHKLELENRVSSYIDTNKIDLVITYEQLGFYGHPDHISLANVVNKLAPQVKTLFATISPNIFKLVGLPKSIMINGEEIKLNANKLKYQPPEYKFCVPARIGKKYRAALAYKSQNLGQGKPIWLIAALGGCEYYTSKFEVQIDI